MKATFVVIGVIAFAVIIWVLTRKSDYQPALQPSYEGDPFEYRGEKALVVAVYAPWASVWKVTEGELAKLDRSKYDLLLVSADRDPKLAKRLDAQVVPTVFVIRDGKIVKAQPNMTSLEQLQ